MPGKAVGHPKCQGCRLALAWVFRKVRQPQGRLRNEQGKEENSKGMTMDGVAGGVPPMGWDTGQNRVFIQARWQRRRHLAANATQDPDSDAAEDAHEEGQEQSLLAGSPQDFAHLPRQRFGGSI